VVPRGGCGRGGAEGPSRASPAPTSPSMMMESIGLDLRRILERTVVLSWTRPRNPPRSGAAPGPGWASMIRGRGRLRPRWPRPQRPRCRADLPDRRGGECRLQPGNAIAPPSPIRTVVCCVHSPTTAMSCQGRQWSAEARFDEIKRTSRAGLLHDLPPRSSSPIGNRDQPGTWGGISILLAFRRPP
jgi:hypothetical protein